ncbi:MAG: AAA family ATPase [Actinobacteria bacterium]|nr:AAA family ATPase [Actinomycetota bacterium]
MTPSHQENGTDGKFLQSVTLRNVLSFGPFTDPLSLGCLNVFIGPNGSGKSNLIDALALLRAAPEDLRTVVRRGGGVREWIWKAAPRDAVALIDAVVQNPRGGQALRHALSFMEENQGFRLCDERIENEIPYEGHDEPYLYYRYQVGRPILNVRGEERRLTSEAVEPDVSILAQRRDPEAYPEITFLAEAYSGIRIFREWAFGRNTVFREPQKADMRNDRLEEDFSNLGLFLNRLRRTPAAKRAILEALGELYAGIDDFDVTVEGGTVQVFLVEGDFTIPATRLSDGSLRYLCLLAILCDPTPPRLVCIEEPELGLHPDILPKVADLLVEASGRTQLIVTTHSDIIVDALSERPETVVVCEKADRQTVMRRLDPDALSGWLREYRLGALWMSGQLGGTRW